MSTTQEVRQSGPAFDKLLVAIEQAGYKVTNRTATTARAQCPAHGGDGQNLSLFSTETRVNAVCHSRDCDMADVLAAVGLSVADRYHQQRTEYRYDDGRTVRRLPGKSFPQSNTKGTPTLYRAAKVSQAVADGVRVLLCEGEEDVHAAEAIGAVATSAPMGAKAFSRADVSPLAGADVVAVVDRDEQGDIWAEQVLATVGPVAKSLRFVRAAHGKDLCDHLTAGHSPTELVPLGPAAIDGALLLEEVSAWLGRFIRVVNDADLDLLTLWAAHTHLVMETYTTPRLQLDSPMPGSGKTTTLEHLQRLCHHPVMMATVSSPALLTRMLDAGMRTILIDEADRSLNPDKEGIADLLAVINSGYKRGATRPVLVSVGSAWVVQEMPTYAPVAMAGNNPNLPDDTRSRIIRVVLLPDLDGTAEESDWELIDREARKLGARLAGWAETTRAGVTECRPVLPERITGRFREKWAPLRRVAEQAGGRWPAVVDALALADRDQHDQDKEDGLITEKPAVVLLRHIAEQWPEDETFWPTRDIVAALVQYHPEAWGDSSPYGRALTVQRFGRMLAQGYKVSSGKNAADVRGYTLASLAPAMRRMGITPPGEPSKPSEPPEPSDQTTAQTSATVSTVHTRGSRIPSAKPSCTVCGQVLHPAVVAGGHDRCVSCEAA